VLQCCASDHRSLFSAAQSHSRLLQAAAIALRGIRAVVPQQQQLDSVLAYLGKYGGEVDSLDLTAGLSVTLRQLPAILQLSSLQLRSFYLQLWPSIDCQGVLGAAAGVAALKQLQLIDCVLLDGDLFDERRLASALLQLPAGLQHLSISSLQTMQLNWALHGSEGERKRQQFPWGVLQHLQHLTYLQLAAVNCKEDPQQTLQALTQLVDLRLDRVGMGSWVLCNVSITASMLSGMHGLTRLQLRECSVEAGVLAGKTCLQHLQLDQCKVDYGSAGVAFAQLMSHLQPLQQLTYLSLESSLQDCAVPTALSRRRQA
jgi:hypothetical protein